MRRPADGILVLGVAVFAVGLLAHGPAAAQTDVLLRMDINGVVEGDPGYDPTMLAEASVRFDNLGFPGGGAPPVGFGSFPDFGGRVQKFYFELPPGVTSILALTVFDDHSLGGGTCVTGQLSFGIYTGQEIYSIQAWDGAGAIYADNVARYIPGDPVPGDPLSIPLIQITDLLYGDDNGDPDCPAYDHLRGTNAGLLPNVTAGLAGVANMLLGPPDPTLHDVYGTLTTSLIYDGLGNAIGILDCNMDMTADNAPGPIYGDPAPPGKRPWPGFVTIGCGGTITVNFAVPAFPKANTTMTVADADIVIYEVGFAEEPFTAVGSATPVGPINVPTPSGLMLDCIGTPGVDSGATGCANIEVRNDSHMFYLSGGFPIFGFEFEKYIVRVEDGSGFYAPQEMEFTMGPVISPDILSPDNTQTIGPFNVTCMSAYYFYAFGDDASFGNPDGDGHPEQVFASSLDLTGISFLGATGISPEPTIYDPGTLLTAVSPLPILSSGVSSTLYAFSTGTPVGSATVKSAMTAEIHPRRLNPRSRGRWVTVYVESETVDVREIDPGTVSVEGLDPTIKLFAVRSAIGDGNENGVDDLMLKFSRSDFVDLYPGTPVRSSSSNLLVTVRGETFAGQEWSTQDVLGFSASTNRALKQP